MVVIEPGEDTTGMDHIGHEVTEELDISRTMVVNQYRRKKYATKTADAHRLRKAALPPDRKGNPWPFPGLLAKVIIDKYTDHLPLYRQSQRFAREGIDIPVSTMADWIARCCELLDPLYEKLRQKILESAYVQLAYETPIKMLDSEKRGATHRKVTTGPTSHPCLGLVLFDYRPGRSRSGPIHVLRNYKGWLQTDGYSAYEEFEKREGIFLVGCMAHVRRYFEKALDYDNVNAGWVLGRFANSTPSNGRRAKNASATMNERPCAKKRPCPSSTNSAYGCATNTKCSFQSHPWVRWLNYFLGRFNYVARYLRMANWRSTTTSQKTPSAPSPLAAKTTSLQAATKAHAEQRCVHPLVGTCKRNDIGTLHLAPRHPRQNTRPPHQSDRGIAAGQKGIVLSRCFPRRGLADGYLELVFPMMSHVLLC